MKHIFNAVAIALSLTSAVAMASATSENTSSTKMMLRQFYQKGV